MKLSLQLKLGQQLAMTPQLQQAIKLLQLSTLDLQQEIHQALESNPMLELIEGIEDDENSAKETDTDSEPASQTAQQTAQTAIPWTIRKKITGRTRFRKTWR